jgi:hypothetical protein
VLMTLPVTFTFDLGFMVALRIDDDDVVAPPASETAG